MGPGSVDGTVVYLTDPIGTGVMLRDNRLTLRSVAALSSFKIELEGSNHYVLESGDCTSPMFLGLGGKNAFTLKSNKRDAVRFQIEPSELGGLELVLDGERPAVFDDFYDLSVGKWQSGRSRIAILVHQRIPGAVQRQEYRP